MKKQYFIYLIIALLAFAACDDDHDDTKVTKVNAVTVEPLSTENYILEDYIIDGDKNSLLFVLRWSVLTFNLDGTPTPVIPVTYNIEMDYWGVGFSNPKRYAAVTTDSLEIYVNELNTFIHKNFEVAVGENTKFELRVSAVYGEGVDKISSSANVLTLNLTPYEAEELGPLQGLYIIGDMNGWDSSNTDFRMFRDNSSESEWSYTYTGKLNGYFKFILEEQLGSELMYYTTGDGQMGYGTSGGDEGSFYVSNKYVTITVDLNNMIWSIVDFDASSAKTYSNICFVGDFCNWGADASDPEMTQSSYDPHIWELKSVHVNNPGYGVKFRENHDWSTRWCPAVNTAIPYGVGRLNPSDDPNISIQEAGNYYVKFNDLTGHYIVLFLD